MVLLTAASKVLDAVDSLTHESGGLWVAKQFERGSLHITIKRAVGLRAADDNRTSDPYVKLVIGSEERKIQPQMKTLDPVWNTEVAFENVSYNAMCSSLLEVSVWDHDTFSLNDSLGAVALRLRDFDLGTGELYADIEVALNDGQRTPGRVTLSLRWEHATPPAGMLLVHLSHAAGLVANDLNGKCDPFVTLHLGGQELRSSVLYDTLDPEWDEVFYVHGELEALCAEMLHVVRIRAPRTAPGSRGASRAPRTAATAALPARARACAHRSCSTTTHSRASASTRTTSSAGAAPCPSSSPSAAARASTSRSPCRATARPSRSASSRAACLARRAARWRRSRARRPSRT